MNNDRIDKTSKMFEELNSLEKYLDFKKYFKTIDTFYNIHYRVEYDYFFLFNGNQIVLKFYIEDFIEGVNTLKLIDKRIVEYKKYLISYGFNKFDVIDSFEKYWKNYRRKMIIDNLLDEKM